MLLESTNGPEGLDAYDGSIDESSMLRHEIGDYEIDPVRDDIERLIEIAAKLFSAIERQIHRIEGELGSSSAVNLTSGEQTMYKEQLIQTVRNLDASLQEIGVQLGERTAISTDAQGNGQSRFLDYF